MTRALFDCLSKVHRLGDLESLLDFVAGSIRDATDWSTVLVTFYFGDDVFYGAAGCPADIKVRFRQSFARTSLEMRRRKRAMLRAYRRQGTNICFIPTGEGPPPATAYVPSRPAEGTWQSDDRLVILMHDWSDEVRGILSLDNPRSGNRPDEAEFARLVELDLFVNVVAKIAENRFWSLRLAESEAAYRGIFDAATDAMMISDEEGRFVEVNQAACRMHGYAYEELIGRPAFDVIHPDDRPTYAGALEAVNHGDEVHAEGRSLRKDGTVFDAEVRAVAFHYRGRRCMLVVLQDVTERKQVLERLLEQQRDESVVAVAGGVAHDFNNLLLGITGSVSLLQRDLAPGTEAARHCERVAASAEKLSGLTGQLLAVARGVHSEQKPVSIGAVLEENLTLIRGMLDGRFHLDLEVDDDLWPVHADRVQLGQVLINLSQNAYEAMQRGGCLRITASNTKRGAGWTCARTGPHPPGEYVRLTVEDEGHGVDAETQRRLFEPYFSTKPAGSGLGLAAVLGIVRRHHGALCLESEPDEGTTLEILLPRSRDPAEEVRIRPPPAPAETERRRVLLVDDDEVVRDVARALLEAIGCEVDDADGGARAVEIYAARERPYDLVLLDATMPGMSGVETFEALLEIDSDVRVLFSSGHTERLVRSDMQGAPPIAGFIQKPYDLKGLRTAVDLAMGTSSPGA